MRPWCRFFQWCRLLQWCLFDPFDLFDPFGQLFRLFQFHWSIHEDPENLLVPLDRSFPLFLCLPCLQENLLRPLFRLGPYIQNRCFLCRRCLLWVPCYLFFQLFQ